MKSGANKKKKKTDRGGIQFNGPVSGNNQTFINGDVDSLNIHAGLSSAELQELEKLFSPLRTSLQDVPAPLVSQAEEKVQELKTELTKGKAASAERLNTILNGIVGLVPGAVGAIATMFGNPILGALVGPATKLVLDHLQPPD